ncbi:MAG: hypothetical protein GY861_10960 [bacterium]|nr:hypothetical protein [bacterium]
MPFTSNEEARKKIPALSSSSDKQVEHFIKVFNTLTSQGVKEGEAIPIAISESKKVEKDTEEDSTVRGANFTLVSKATPADVKRDKAGNIVYQGKKFAGFNKPRKSDREGKDGMVVAKRGNQIKLVHFGDANMRHNYSSEANDAYHARHGSESDVFSAKYWSNNWLWPKGSLKGKGGKPWVPLKKSEVMEMDKNKDAFTHLLQSMLSMLSGDKKEVDEYEDIDDLYDDEDELEDIEDSTWNENDGDVFFNKDKNHVELVKQFDEEEMVAIEPLYINVGDVDAHGDGISDEELDKLIDNFNKNIKNISGNIHHTYMTDGFYPVKAYRMPMDVYIGDTTNPHSMVKIPEGQPVVKVQFRDNVIGKELWEKRKCGTLRGVSIGAKGKRVKNPNYQGDM